MVENERGRNVLARIDEEQRAIQAAIAAQPELRPKPTRKEKPRNKKPRKLKPTRTPVTIPVNVRPRRERGERAMQVSVPKAALVRSEPSQPSETLWQRFPGVASSIDQLRNPQIRAALTVVFDDREVQQVLQSTQGYIQHGEVEEHRTELAGAIFHALVFQLAENRFRGNSVVLKPSEVKSILLGQPNAPDGLLLIPSEDGKRTEIVAGYQYIHSRHIVPLKKSDTVVDLIGATSGSAGSAHISDYLQKRYPRLPQRVTVDRQDFVMRYVLPADLEAPMGISERDIDRVPLSGRELGILVTRLTGDLRSVHQR